MTFGKASRRLGTVAAVGLLLLSMSPASAGAAEQSYHLTGKVSLIQGTAQAKLAGLGVTKGAAVSIDWTVELTTPPYFDNVGTHTKEYHGAITAMKIQIGTWAAQGADPNAFNTVPVNKIDIFHGPFMPPEDNLDMWRSSVDTADPNTGLGLVTGNDPNGSQIIIHLFAPMGSGSADNVLGDQDPTQYPESNGAVSGVGGAVAFAIPGITGPPPPDPTASCRSAQIASAAALCQGTLKCLAVRAKQTPAQIAKNPGSLQTCEDKASAKFATAFDKATAAAAKKGLSCGTTEPAATFISNFDTAVDAVIAVVDTIHPPAPLFVSPWYTAAGAMCAAAVKAESKYVKKPSPATLAQLRAAARAKATTLANKAIAKAESKGVNFDPAPDVTALVDSIDALIDDIVTELNGP